ncbi:MAG: sensor histidine kinase [Geminicoccaceae bacterium]
MTSTAAPASLISRTLWRVLPAIVIVQLVIGWLAWTAMQDLVSTELESRLHRQAEQYAALIAVKLETVIGTATSVAENDLIVNGIMDAEGRDQYIPVFFETAQVSGLAEADAEITLADYKGRRIASNRQDVDYSDAAWLPRVLNGEVWHEVRNRAFTVAAPVMIADQGEGLIVIRYEAAELARLVTVPARADAIAVLADASDPIYSSNPAFAGLSQADEDGRPDWAVMSAGIPGFEELRLLAAERRAKAMATVDWLGLYLGAAMLSSIAAVVIAIAATAYMGTRPVHSFIDNVEQITRTGDLGQTIKIEGTREFHRLAGAFNRMLKSLKSTTASRDALQKLNAGLAEANEALDHANAELERSNRELDDFAHIASHDLKEPLRAISNHANFLLEDYSGKLDEDGEKRLNRLIKLSHRMETLIADLLFFSRIRKGEIEEESIDLNAIIADIEVSLADMMRQRNARLLIPRPLPTVTAAGPHMRTVFQNLITNAIKYNDSEEKIVEIGVDENQNAAAGPVFNVCDNGIGIEDTFKTDIFRIFKRLNSEKAYGEGTGAGLTFVKKIIENQGGKIWLESTPGEGSAFYFTLDGASA